MSDDFGGEAKQDSSWTLPITVIGVTLLLSFGFVYYYFGPTINELRGNTPAPSESNVVIPMTLGGEHFEIPTNYTLLPKDRRGGVRESVSLYALLPEFDPFSTGLSDTFDDNAADSPVIYFDLTSYQSALEEKDRLEKVYMNKVIDQSGRQGPYGFKIYEFVQSTGYKDQDLFVKRYRNKPPTVIRCYRQTENIPSPHCTRDMRLTDNLSMSYRYKRPWLAQWEAIDENLRALTDSFRVETAAPSVN